MAEKILKIDEIYGWSPRDDGDKQGFKITTDSREIFIVLAFESQCCERYGHIASEDSFDDFIGASLTDVYVTNTELKRKPIKSILHDEDQDRHDRRMNLLFVNLDTEKGTLQFVLYNSHNGYYGHLADVYYIQNDQTHKMYEGVL